MHGLKLAIVDEWPKNVTNRGELQDGGYPDEIEGRIKTW
jgi:hypothetical protein